MIGSFAQDLGNAFIASLGLLMISLTISTILGMLMGLLAVRNQPPGSVAGSRHYLRLDWQCPVFTSVV